MSDSASIDSNHATFTFDPLVYRVAREADCDSLVTLINSSYRGELSRQGWTNENELVSGPRTNSEKVLDMITGDKYVCLVFFGESDKILKGCIHLVHKRESKMACLGTFAVRPDFQGRGYGKFILSVAENYAVNNWNVEYIELNVMIQRSELGGFYNRRGYIDNGHHQTFSI
jgi:GNAT superfamily N-acetyltransferase